MHWKEYRFWRDKNSNTRFRFKSQIINLRFKFKASKRV